MRQKRTDLMEQAKAIHAAMMVMGRTAPDEVVLSVPTAFDLWVADTPYEVGDVRRYESQLYRCLTAHTSQTTWIPDVSPSLWVRIDDPAEEWPAWVQPAGSTDAYPKGAKVSHNGKHWVSDVDSNTWEPGVYGWTEVV